MMRSAIFFLSLMVATAIFGGNAFAVHSAPVSGIAHTANSRYGSFYDDAESAKPASQVIVIGFVGGFVRHDDPVHSGVQLAARLRQDYPSGVYINTFENHQGDQAHREVLHLLDTNHDGALSADEKRNARVVIYGHSWGASETVTLANQLNRDGIPVLLTIQVDSVEKSGEDDSVIPPNVAQAVNFYQSDGLLHGRPAIRAADPAHTQILGNFRQDGIRIAFHVSPLVVLQTAFDIDLNNLDMVRPGWYVLAAGLAMVVLDFVCARWRTRRPRKAAKPRIAGTRDGVSQSPQKA